VFEGFTITREDARDAYGELRLQTLGLWNGIVVFVVHTARGNADHVISDNLISRILRCPQLRVVSHVDIQGRAGYEIHAKVVQTRSVTHADAAVLRIVHSHHHF